MILQETIQEVFDTADIEEVVGEFVHLKRRGANLIGLCPFHDEKTPSFTVSPSKGIYKCFGCGRGGNPVNFLMEHEQLSFPEAIRYLAQKYNIEIKEDKRQEDDDESRERESLFVLTEFVQEFYHHNLLHTEEGTSIGKSYFKERHLSDATIEKFNLGYAPESGDALVKEATAKTYSLDKLKVAGLLNRYDKDFFRGRIIFPIHNLSGKVVAFAGRTLSSRPNVPKYINSPETEIYHKRKILYGMHQARNSVRRQNQCILVEGYTDVLSLVQEGIENVVATSGTALTTEQIRLIKRYSENILMLYDGDEAGLNAAERGIDLILEQDLNISIVMLPDKHDPDSFIKAVGKSEFEDYLQNEAQDFILFKLKHNKESAATSPIKRANLIKDLVRSVAVMPDPLKQALYLKQISEQLEIQEEILTSELAKSRKEYLDIKNRERRSEERRREREAQPTINETQTSVRHKMPELSDKTQEKDIIRILLQFGQRTFNHETHGEITVGENVLANIVDVRASFEDELCGKVLDIFEKHLQDTGEILDFQYFIQHQDKDIRELAIDLLSEPYTYSPNWLEKWDMPLQTQVMPDENYFADMTQSMYHLKLRKIDKLIEENRNKIAMFQKDGNEKDLIIHLEVQKSLIQIRKAIAENLGRVLY